LLFPLGEGDLDLTAFRLTDFGLEDISLRATVPGLYRCGGLIPPVSLFPDIIPTPFPPLPTLEKVGHLKRVGDRCYFVVFKNFPYC